MSPGSDDANNDGAPAADDAGRTPPAKSGPTQPARPSPAASAASRARRIGGPVTRPDTSRAKSATAKVSISKVEPAKAETATPTTTAGAKAAKTDKTAQKVRTAKKDKAAKKDKTTRPSRSRRPLPAWALWTPPVVFLAIAAVFIVLIVADRAGDSPSAPSPRQRDVVLAATKNCVAATNTYRYTDVDKYEKAGLKCATGVYAGQYRNAMDTLIKKNAPTQKFVQLAQVNTAGVETVADDGKQWTVLVYGQLNITNTATGKNGRVDPFALVATMQRVKGSWLIAAIKLLATPTG